MLLAIRFIDFIQRLNVIVGMVIACLGLALIFMSRSFAKAVEKENEPKNTKTYVFCRVIGIILILIGMVLIALPKAWSSWSL